LFKASVITHGTLKYGKDHLAQIQLTIRAYTDTSVDDPLGWVSSLTFAETS
jgi:hypothetical protein